MTTPADQPLLMPPLLQRQITQYFPVAGRDNFYQMMWEGETEEFDEWLDSLSLEAFNDFHDWVVGTGSEETLMILFEEDDDPLLGEPVCAAA